MNYCNIAQSERVREMHAQTTPFMTLKSLAFIPFCSIQPPPEVLVLELRSVGIPCDST